MRKYYVLIMIALLVFVLTEALAGLLRSSGENFFVQLPLEYRQGFFIVSHWPFLFSLVYPWIDFGRPFKLEDGMSPASIALTVNSLLWISSLLIFFAEWSPFQSGEGRGGIILYLLIILAPLHFIFSLLNGIALEKHIAINSK
jgi:hypothetical protein